MVEMIKLYREKVRTSSCKIREDTKLKRSVIS